MRIITGTAGGIKIETLSGPNIRPTSDRIKQALFNIIQFDIVNKNVLDLFAGSGQLGLEALSRGAKSAVFVDNSRAAISVIKKNAIKANLIEKSLFFHCDYRSFLKSAKNQDFELVFLDPPYREGFLKTILNEIFAFDIVAVNGIIICESDAKEMLPLSVGDISLVKTYPYGTTALSMYKKTFLEK